MEEVKHQVVMCTHCHKPMQAADTVFKEGKTVSIRYVCGCLGSVYSLNVHAGQK